MQVNSNSPASRWRGVFDAATIAVFLLLVCLPTLDLVFRLDHAPVPAENRQPAAWPQFQGWTQSRAFISGLESYFNDHFGFRRQLVHWNNHWKGQLFTDASRHDALVGREGWVYFSGERMFEHWSRQEAWGEQDLEHWRQMLELRRDWLRARGVHYVFVVAPDKQSIYPEYMPEWVHGSSKPAKLDQLNAFLQAHASFQVLDLRPALIAARKAQPTYLKTDSHWNQFGGFVGSREIIQALSAECHGLQPLPADAYDWKPGEQVEGDLARVLGDAARYPESYVVEPVARGSLPTLQTIWDPARRPQCKPKDAWVFSTHNAQAHGKALVFGDSFAKALRPFLGQYFQDVIFVPNTTYDHSLIEQEKPDVVIDEVVERAFNLRDPLAMARKEQSPP